MKHETSAELYYDGAWNAAPVLTRDEIVIVRGNPASAALTLDNASEDYSPRSVAGSLFGKIGQGTPIRILCELDPLHADPFDRTVTSGWGTSPDAGVWTSARTAGVSTDSTVSTGMGRHAVPATGNYALAWLGDVRTDDPDVSVTVTLPMPTGGDLEPTIMLAFTNTSNYYMLRATINTAGAVTLSLRSFVAGVDTLEASAASGVTHAAATPLHLRARMSAGTLEMKAWQGSTEPAAFQLSAQSSTIVTRGAVGIRSGRGGGNTNAGTQFAYDDFTVTIGRTRFVGEVTSWIPERPIKGSGWTKIRATGIRARLGRGKDPMESPLTRAALTVASLVAGWPMSGGYLLDSATAGANAFSVVAPDDIPDLVRQPKYASVPLGDGSAPGLDLGGGARLTVTPPPGDAGTGEWSIEWVTNPGGQTATSPLIVRAYFGTAENFMQVSTLPPGYPGSGNGEIEIAGFKTPFIITTLLNSTFINVYDNVAHHIRFGCRQEGSDIGVYMWVDGVLLGNGTLTSTTLTPPSMFSINHTADADQATWGFGQFYYYSVLNPGDKTFEAFAGHVGEPAGTRFNRLNTEHGIATFTVGDDDDSVAMGPQQAKTLFDLQDEMERTDDALIFEARAALALGMFTGQSRLNQDSRLTLSYTAGGIAPTLSPVVGDSHIRNDVTAANPDGATSRVVVEDGPLGVDTVGRYGTRMEVNTETAEARLDAAGWRTNRGIFNGTWYEIVTVDLDAREDLIPAVAAMDIGDVLTLADLPPSEALEAVEHQTLGYTETIGSHRRRVAFALVPGEPYRVGLLASTSGDTRDFLGRLETDGSSTVSLVAAGAASFQAATPSGPLWTTVADDYPMDLIVGGQEISVSACSGASSPQTFTVQVGGKQVVYPIPAGSAINVADPIILTQ